MERIPAPEHLFYSDFARTRAVALSRMNHIEDILSLEQSQSFRYLVKIVSSTTRDFPNPYDLWVDARYDGLAEWDTYRFLAPLTSKRILQVGGTGVAAIKFMLGGAADAWLLTPVAEEIRLAEELARLAGVKLHHAIGAAEEMPFAEGFFDAVYAGGCAHHFETEVAFPEIARVLKPAGRFAAVEPWRAPLYSLGIKVFGKREGKGQVQCRPLTEQRIGPLQKSFSHFSVVHHGTFLRYPALAANKLGLSFSDAFARTLARMDDRLADGLHARRWGSSVAVLAEK